MLLAKEMLSITVRQIICLNLIFSLEFVQVVVVIVLVLLVILKKIKQFKYFPKDKNIKNYLIIILHLSAVNPIPSVWRFNNHRQLVWILICSKNMFQEKFRTVALILMMRVVIIVNSWTQRW